MNKDAISLLEQLIATPSFSREETGTADILARFFTEKGIPVQRKHNNVWVKNSHTQTDLPTILLNSHHDTVRPVSGWQRDPFKPSVDDEKIYGLGSNDAGGPLVALIICFLHYYEREGLPFNLVMAATAEEEISGEKGISSILSELGQIDLAIVGEPTQMHMAVAEKGLLVIDAQTKGKSGHAAREEGENAIYKALEDIQWLRQFTFPQESNLLGPVKLSVTQINAGVQHNVVPDSCQYVIDVRTNEHYSNQQIFAILEKHLKADLNARSFRLNSSGIDLEHPLVKKAVSMGLKTFGSPTLSDQAMLRFSSVKIGPGNSARSHTADEFIYIHELEEGIATYIRLLENLKI